jgi:hypothetical protein
MALKSGFKMEQDQVYNVFWELCDSYERMAGSRAALNSFLTRVFRRGANLEHVVSELRRSVQKLKLRN